MKTIQYPDYQNCITNLACSILKEFGIEEQTNASLQVCDEIFQGQYKNIVVILLDGMGKSIMDHNLEPDGFLSSHLQTVYSSVFPPTTVAATTSIDSGKNPAGHGWLGWDCYYKELDKNVTVFSNNETGTDKPAAEFWAAWTYCPYESVVNRIKAAGGQAFYATPFAEPFPSDFPAVCKHIEKLCKLDGKKYIYGYWNEPDHIMHRKGCFHKDSKAVLQELEKEIEKLCENLEDTVVIVTADHGHMDSEGVTIKDYPKLLDCLVRMPSIEPRALNFFVKDGCKKQFETEFQKEFGEKFLLLTKEEVKKQKLFGTGEEHTRFDEMLGDYLVVAVDDLSIYSTKEECDMFIGVHAGLTKEEMNIPLIVIDKK